MSKIKLTDGTTFVIEDYATQADFSVSLASLADIESVLSAMTDENLAEVQFLTDADEVVGVYRNKTFRRSIIARTDVGYLLTVNIGNCMTVQEQKALAYDVLTGVSE